MRRTYCTDREKNENTIEAKERGEQNNQRKVSQRLNGKKSRNRKNIEEKKNNQKKTIGNEEILREMKKKAKIKRT